MRVVVQQTHEERRLEESLNKETVEIRAQKDEGAELRGAPGFFFLF